MRQPLMAFKPTSREITDGGSQRLLYSANSNAEAGMKRREIPLLEALVYRRLCQNPSRWMSARELARQFKGVTARRIRAHCLNLVKRGLIEQPKVFPAHRYRVLVKVR
jgi:hypothetical protein